VTGYFLKAGGIAGIAAEELGAVGQALAVIAAQSELV
jgi:hypothetical protein